MATVVRGKWRPGETPLGMGKTKGVMTLNPLSELRKNPSDANPCRPGSGTMPASELEQKPKASPL